MKAAKTVFLCSNCGNETPRWQGRCPSCGQWNTLEEYTPPQAAAPSRSSLSNRTSAARGVGVQPKRLNEVTSGEELRFGTGLSELDRVLGGGAVRGSLVLVSGAPGIGKSTLLLQICAQICREQTILYVSGEESENQLKLRAERLGVQSDALWLLCETSLDEILAAAERMQPGLLIVDSIQTLYTEDKTSSPGSIAQVRDCTMRLMQYSKRCGVTVFVVGHINKEGAIAGPKVLEHMVDCVLYFEGEEHTTYRLLRAGGTYSIHELGLQPDDLPEPVKDEVRKALARSIKVNARPLTEKEWRELLESEGFEVLWSGKEPMALLDMRRNLADEGLGGVLRILRNMLGNKDIRARVMNMKSTFHKYSKELNGIAFVVRKPAK